MPAEILLVEDRESLRAMLAETLTREGYSVEAVATGDEALRRLAEGRRYTLVLTDFKMPGAAGLPEQAGRPRPPAAPRRAARARAALGRRARAPCRRGGPHGNARHRRHVAGARRGSGTDPAGRRLGRHRPSDRRVRHGPGALRARGARALA